MLFPRLTSVSEAHRLATILEERLPTDLGMPAEVITQLECLEDHAEVHHEQHYTGKPDSLGSGQGERFAREVRKLGSGYNAALWVMEREFKKVNCSVSERIHTRREVEKEFPFVARLTAAALGPILLWSTRREEKGPASGHTYEPPTFTEPRNRASQWVSAS